jgi:PPOX class probable F420-dependent enzyme
MGRADALERLRSARVGRIATVRPDGRPHVVPFVFALVEDRDAVCAYWTVDAKPKRTSALQRLRNLERDPAVEIVVDGYDEDWDRLWWVRGSGLGRIVEDPVERAAALDALRAKYPQYRSAALDGAVVAIDLIGITGWTAVRTG